MPLAPRGRSLSQTRRGARARQVARASDAGRAARGSGRGTRRGRKAGRRSGSAGGTRLAAPDRERFPQQVAQICVWVQTTQVPVGHQDGCALPRRQSHDAGQPSNGLGQVLSPGRSGRQQSRYRINQYRPCVSRQQTYQAPPAVLPLGQVESLPPRRVQRHPQCPQNRQSRHDCARPGSASTSSVPMPARAAAMRRSQERRVTGITGDLRQHSVARTGSYRDHSEACGGRRSTRYARGTLPGLARSSPG
jgi:hypothetical protein